MMVVKIVVTAGKGVVCNFSMVKNNFHGNFPIVMGMLSNEYGYENVHVPWEPPPHIPHSDIYGRITDMRGNMISHAEVNVYKSGALITKRQANANGEYDITKLEPGVYDLGILSSGYETISIERITLPDGKTMKDAVMAHSQNASTIPANDK